jgi:hypothetical protein
VNGRAIRQQHQALCGWRIKERLFRRVCDDVRIVCGSTAQANREAHFSGSATPI